MMVLGVRRFVFTVLLLGGVYQSSAHALTDYVATGTFIADSLQVIQYVYDPETDEQEEVFVDAFVDSHPFPIPSSTYTLGFTVDESVDGSVCVFCSFASFSGAVSNISLDINGTNIFSSATEVATPIQFPGDFQELFPARWDWSFSPQSGSLPLPDLSVIDNNTFESLGVISNDGFSLRLFDSSREIYSETSILDLIELNLNDFDAASFQLFWYNGFDEEPEFGEEPPEINYTVFASVDSLTNLSAVPLPAGVWLLLSALSGFAVVARRNLDA